MNTKDLRIKSITELYTELESLLKTHFSLRVQSAAQKIIKTSEIRKLKRAIARVKTIIHEKKAA